MKVSGRRSMRVRRNGRWRDVAPSRRAAVQREISAQADAHRQARYSHERYVVEAFFATEQQHERLLSLVRKPVSFSGGGNYKFSVSIGWSFATRRAAERARQRLRAVRGSSPYLIDLDARSET